jgi:hypothetical protein
MIIEHVIHGQQINGVQDRAGHLASTVAVEAINYKEKPDWADKVMASIEPSSSQCPGKRNLKLMVNTLYSGNQFWHHYTIPFCVLYLTHLLYCLVLLL